MTVHKYSLSALARSMWQIAIEKNRARRLEAETRRLTAAAEHAEAENRFLDALVAQAEASGRLRDKLAQDGSKT